MTGISIKSKKGVTLSELLFVFLAVLFIAALMLPVIRYTHKRVEKILCADNLQKLGMAMYIYASEHDGKFPDSLKVLYDEKYLSDITLLDCPGSKKKGTIEAPEYIYTAGLSVKNPSLAPLVEDRSGNHSGRGINVLLVNGSIEWRE